MRVLFVTAEAYPLAKTGGLGDVSRALPLALKHSGVDIRLLMPAYPGALGRIENPRIVAKLDPVLGIADATLISGCLPGTGVTVLMIDAPSLFRRVGGIYQDKDGQDWPDNAKRFAFLSHTGAMIAMGRTSLDWEPDVIHANDWHAGLVPLLLSREEGPRPHTVFTTHNMAFQGNFPPDVLGEIGVPPECFSSGDIEFYGQVSFLKAGLGFADRVTTVSPTYAKEVLTPDGGCGMDGLLRARGTAFSGILNGIDDVLWDPALDPMIPQQFRASDIAGKRVCKAALQREYGLPIEPETPLIGFVSRIAHQKMADCILDSLPWIADQGAHFVLLGEGEQAMERGLEAAQAKFPENISIRIGYDEAQAHRLQAGCDILLAPARFEPCGLTQLYALRYGTLPVVRRTGGLADTVVDVTPQSISERRATGFVFDEATTDGLIGAMQRALAIYGEPLAWRRVQLQAMAQDFSWTVSAASYLDLYREVAAETALPSVETSVSEETSPARKMVL